MLTVAEAFGVCATLFTLTSALVSPSPGSSACTQINTHLGNDKVQYPLGFSYLFTQQDYWSTKASSCDPSCVVYPTSAQDVSTALKIIKSSGSRFAVKAGGHNPNAFFSSVEGGVLIDMNSMTERSYDPFTTIGTYQPGGVFGEIYEYFQQFGRTVVGARLADIGTGLNLGGGLSYLSGQYGMACDSFLELEVVLPSGDIVTASPTENEDLFFAERGGGGNAYGVVTKYTVQTRPSGTLFAGNVVYLFEQADAVLQVIRDFAAYNTDPKAAIIGTHEMLGTLDLGNLQLDEFVLMFLVYDGEDAGDVFANFTSLPHVANTLGQKSYKEVVDMPSPLLTKISRGDNIFRVQAYRLDDGSLQRATDAWETWCANNKGSYAFTSLGYQPIPKSLTDVSKAANGGNAMQMPDGPWIWVEFIFSTPQGMPTSIYNQVQASFRDMVNSVPKSEGLPLFPNAAHYDQNPLKTFSTYPRLQEIKQKYDPDGFFANYTGGWSFA